MTTERLWKGMNVFLTLWLLMACGMAGAVTLEQVNTTSPQTLTNKTLNGVTITGTVLGDWTQGGEITDLHFPSYTEAALPGTCSDGAMAIVTDNEPGIRRCVGNAWILPRFLVLRDFGAIPGDGVDDETAINTAIQAADDAGGLKIRCEEGQYDIGASVLFPNETVGVHLICPGDDATTFNWTGGGSDSVIDFNGCAGCRLEGLTIQGPGTGTSGLIGLDYDWDGVGSVAQSDNVFHDIQIQDIETCLNVGRNGGSNSDNTTWTEVGCTTATTGLSWHGSNSLQHTFRRFGVSFATLGMDIFPDGGFTCIECSHSNNTDNILFNDDEGGGTGVNDSNGVFTFINYYSEVTGDEDIATGTLNGPRAVTFINPVALGTSSGLTCDGSPVGFKWRNPNPLTIMGGSLLQRICAQNNATNLTLIGLLGDAEVINDSANPAANLRVVELNNAFRAASSVSDRNNNPQRIQGNTQITRLCVLGFIGACDTDHEINAGSLNIIKQGASSVSANDDRYRQIVNAGGLRWRLDDNTGLMTLTSGGVLTSTGDMLTGGFFRVSGGAESQTCADSGDASHGSLSFTPAKSVIFLTNSDSDGCDLILQASGTNDTEKITLIVISNAGGTISLADSEGTHELEATTVHLVNGDIFQAVARSTTWRQVSPLGLSTHEETATCADSGDSSAGTLTLDPTKPIVRLTNSDSDGCTVTMAESNAYDGRRVSVRLDSNAGGTVTFADVSGVLEGPNIEMTSASDAFVMHYANGVYVVDGYSPNGSMALRRSRETCQTWDPANLAADGDVTAVTSSVTGAAAGMTAVATHDQLGANNLMLSAHVQAADTVRVVLQNKTGGAHDVASGQLCVHVFDVATD